MGRYERKTEMPTIKLYKDDISALMLLPEKQFMLAIKIILDVHDKISDRNEYKVYIGKIPCGLEKYDLPDVAKKRIIKILSEMPEDIDRYWKRAEINANNRARGGYKRE